MNEITEEQHKQIYFALQMQQGLMLDSSLRNEEMQDV